MTLVLSVFPRRPIRIVWTGVLSPLRFCAGALVMLLLAGAAAAWMGPGILRDMKIKEAPVAVSAGQITDGRCRTTLVLTICGAKLAYSVSGRWQATSVDFFFVDLHFGSYAVGIVRSATRPELATLDIGLNKIWNRIGTLLVIVVLLLGVGCTAVRRAVDAARLERIAATANRLRPMVVAVKQIAKDRRGAINVRCSYDDDGRKREFVQCFPKPGIPFLLNGGSALAVRPAGSPAMLLLDEALTKLDLTHAERQALYAARSGVAAQPGWSYAAAAS